MEQIIVANFDTRRDAQTAIERLVQEHGIERADIFIRAHGTANTAGTGPAGPTSRAGIPASKSTASRSWPGLSRSPSNAMPAGHCVRSALEKAGARKLRAE